MPAPLFLFVWSFGFCLYGLAGGSLASWDEAFYALVSREIVRTGDWVNLYYFDGPFYDKPPLYLWSTALFYHLFGINEFASRLGSALSGVGLTLVTYAIGKKLFDRTAAFAGAAVLLTSTDFLSYSHFGTLDIMLLFFFSLCFLYYLKAVDDPRHWIAFWLASAAVVMTKGPLIVLAWPVFLLDSILRRDFSFLKRMPFWAGFAIFWIAVLPWHLAVYFKHPDLFMQGIVIKHYFARTGEAVEGHAGTWYFYVRTLINKYHPWIVLAPVVLPWVVWRVFRSRERGLTLLLAWAVIVFSFFTFAVKTKLQWYILLLHPALSMLIGVFLARTVYTWPVFASKPDLWIKLAIAAGLILHIPFSSVYERDHMPAMKSLADEVKKAAPAGRPIYLYNYHEQPAGTFYFDRIVSYADSIPALEESMRTEGSFVLVSTKQDHARLVSNFDRLGLKKISETNGLKTDLVLLARS